jgi:hypothetical protein
VRANRFDDNSIDLVILIRRGDFVFAQLLLDDVYLEIDGPFYEKQEPPLTRIVA